MARSKNALLETNCRICYICIMVRDNCFHLDDLDCEFFLHMLSVYVFHCQLILNWLWPKHYWYQEGIERIYYCWYSLLYIIEKRTHILDGYFFSKSEILTRKLVFSGNEEIVAAGADDEDKKNQEDDLLDKTAELVAKQLLVTAEEEPMIFSF